MDYKVFDSFLDGIIVVNKDTTIEYINPIATQMIDISSKRVVGKKKLGDCFDFSKPLYDSNIQDIQSAQPYKELEMVNAQGQTLTLQTNIQPEKEDDSSNKCWIIYLKDITVETRLKNKYDLEQFEKQIFKIASETDPLTEIYNRGAFEKKLDSYFSNYKNNSGNLSLIFFDIDDFKSLNDERGHLAGDYVLKEVADRIRMEGIRGKDFFARFGGEEFVIILPDCNAKDAMIVGERVRLLTNYKAYTYNNESFEVSISVGISTLTNVIKTPKELIEQADQATYTSKNQGKNRVTLYKP